MIYDDIQVAAAEADDREFIYIEMGNLVPTITSSSPRSPQSVTRAPPRSPPELPRVTWLRGVLLDLPGILLDPLKWRPNRTVAWGTQFARR